MLGWLLFDSELTLKNIMGIALAIAGMVVYSWAVEVEKQRHSKVIPGIKEMPSEEDLELLKRRSIDSNSPLEDVEMAKSKS